MLLAQHGRLVGRDDSHVFGELTDASRPAVDHQQAPSNDRQLRHADEVDDANDDKVSIDYLFDVLAQQGGLQVRENSSGLHICYGFSLGSKILKVRR